MMQVPVHSTNVPNTDIFESSDEYLVIADLPGATATGLNIRVEGERLLIEASMDAPCSGTEVEREFRSMAYRRSFVLPPEVDRKGVSADIKNGVFHLHLPKSEEIKPRRIKVKAG
jgi:HSP20 family molecular chaperone IbpA